MKRYTLIIIIMSLMCGSLRAQRNTDALSRGLVAVNMNNGSSNIGNFVSWRILGEEYYDVTYNIYRNGTKLNSAPLKVSNYTDTGGSATSTYTVSAVVRGVEQTQCAAVTPWSCQYYKIANTSGTHREYPGYKDITLQSVYSYAGVDMTSTYSPNDAEVADLDGDGELEIIIKRISTTDNNALYVTMSDPAYDVFEAYKMNGTRLWWIDAGPNMVSGGSHEFNLIAYDWDHDGKAEVVLRGADGMVLHHADGTTTTIGDASVNTRSSITHTANLTYTNTGSEYLIYMNGETGKEYQVLTYPLARGTASDWGDSYGHRSSKYFMGAPYLDGRTPSIFLARGIYTQHKMAAYDVNASTHTLTQRWTWNCNNSSSAWYGQGYHNFGIADVDWDGRDEIVYGSMVIDDNGKGLSTTGLGHGDAQHCGDFDPYRHGQEIFACNETKPAMNYRDATTSELLYRKTSTSDDGRALCGNFTDTYPGCEGSSSQSGFISCVAADSVATYSSMFDSGELDFRIYWDGDLCDEVLWSKSANGAPMINKPGTGRLFTASTGTLNNSTKNTPCFEGDILGDWREEMIVSNGTNIRIYTTAIASDYGIYTLWHDMQYRQAMVWQMHAYNQPPHTSYFLGALEGITVPPPPLTMTGRTEIADGATISSTYDNKHIMMCKTSNMTVGVVDEAAPYIFTDNAPTWVQGNDDNNNITTTTYTHTLTGGAFTGTMRLVKQGDGILVLPNVTESYTGKTSVWAGTLKFDGTMTSSPVWLNRFAILNSDGGTFGGGITMDYAAQIIPGGTDNEGCIKTRALTMNFGSRAIIDLYSSNITADRIYADTLTIGTKNWTNGPKYKAPVLQFVQHNLSGASAPANGKYLIGKIGTLSGSLSDFVVEGLSGVTYQLELSGDNLYLVIGDATNGQETFLVSAFDSPADGIATGTEHVALTYGTDFSSTVGTGGSDNTLAADGFEYYDVNATAPNVDVDNNNLIPTTGCFYKLATTERGTLKVAVGLEAGKDAYVTEDNYAIAKTTNSGSATATQYITIDARAGYTYHLYTPGGTLQLYGYTFKPATATTTYAIASAENVMVRERVRSVDYINMTYGGFTTLAKDRLANINGSTTGDSYTINTTNATDTWTAGVAITGYDGFGNYTAGNGQNALSEDLSNFTASNYKTVPNHGTYYKFEPKKNGTLIAYVYLNGSRNLYMADEFGTVITADSYATRSGTLTANSDGSYTASTKSALKMTYSLKAGKTYFLFGTSTKLGFCGFDFEPATDASTDVTLSGAYTPTAVTLANATFTRTFVANKWNSLVLPFSMTQDQVAGSFGEGTQIMQFDGISNNILVFKRHYEQTIKGGQPCLIYPTFGDDATSTASVKSVSLAIKDVNINTADAALKTGDLYQSTYNGDTYTFTGTYDANGIPAYSYYVSSKNSNGTWTNGIYFTTTARSASPFIAYLTGPETTTAKINGLLFNDYNDDSVISGISTANTSVAASGRIYNLNGQLISTSGMNNKLAKGVYIIDGKKIVIR